MNELSKQKWLTAAEVFDTWRVIPRLLVGSYYIAYLHLLYLCWAWFERMTLNGAQATEIIAASAFPGLLLTGLAAVMGKLTNDYMANGRNWDNVAKQSMVTTTTATSSEPIK